MPTAVVTGAFSFIGSAAARSLLARGYAVRSLTNRSVPVNDPGGPVEVHPLQFTDTAALVDAMRGADIFVNTYWVRYPYVGTGFDTAVANTRVLLDAARDAGIRRFVQVSVSNPSLDSPLDYYRGKAQTEALVRDSGLSYAIVRPTLVVGPNDILINNVAWLLRRFPVFAMPGNGRYRVQPVTLADTGEIIADSAIATEDMIVDAAGPEIVTFEKLVRATAAAIGRPARIVHVPPSLVLAALKMLNRMVGEVILSRQELDGLMTELLVSHEPPRGHQSVTEWLNANAASVGSRYASEIERHVRRSK
ncbi:MAG TPA: NAD(P)H-binding protein [Dehalococcoidia bacterium]|nr:NAD(P)H-binding protein [Dehalococcoidia bacterium]